MNRFLRFVFLGVTGLVASASLAACGSDVDLGGMYRVDVHTRNDSACGPGDAVATPLFLKFEKMSLFGNDFYQYRECRDAGGADCDPSPGLFGLSYGEPTDTGWDAKVTFSSGSNGQCVLGQTVSSATLNGNQLRIETREEQLQLALPDDKCTTDAATAHESELTCSSLEVLQATKL